MLGCPIRLCVGLCLSDEGREPRRGGPIREEGSDTVQASATPKGSAAAQSYVLLPPRRGAQDKTCFAQLTPLKACVLQVHFPLSSVSSGLFCRTSTLSRSLSCQPSCLTSSPRTRWPSSRQDGEGRLHLAMLGAD